MDKPNFVYISKIDAAKRQLEAVIRLFLQHSDIVVIHTLIGAAHNILADLAKNRKVGETLLTWEATQKRIKKEYQKRFYKELHEAKNFFKHGAKSEDKTVEFNPATSEYYIFDSCNLYHAMTQEITPLMSVFKIWFFCKHTHLLLDQSDREAYEKIKIDLPHTDRAKYLEALPYFENMRMKL